MGQHHINIVCLSCVCFAWQNIDPSQQAQKVESMLVTRWSNVVDAGPAGWTNNDPALIQCRVPARLLRDEPPFQQTILAQLCFSFVEGGPIFDQHWFKFIIPMLILH